MKLVIKCVILLGVLGAAGCMIQQRIPAQQTTVDYQVFYDELSPYGTWVDYPSYGYVWMPNEGQGFVPYATAGHWIFTEDGWTWASDYPWGWAPFHYGRGGNDDERGWFWVPDNEWGPAWVSWRCSPGYYGWAPLRPGISINVSFGSQYREREDRWNFVREMDMTRSDVSLHYIDRGNNITIINNSTLIINTRKDSRRNTSYIAGPSRDDIQRATHQNVHSYDIHDTDRPGHRVNDGAFEIYRPQIHNRNGNGHQPAPKIITNVNDARPGAGRERNTPQPGNTGPVRQPAPVRPAPVTPPPATPTPVPPTPHDQGRHSEQPPPVNPAPPSVPKRKDKQQQRQAPPARVRAAQPSKPASQPHEEEKKETRSRER